MLARNPEAKTIVLAPTVSLAMQHCSTFVRAGFCGPPPRTMTLPRGPAIRMPRSTAASHDLFAPAPAAATAATAPFLLSDGRQPRVDCFFSDQQLRAECWQEELSRLSVLVIEAGSFRNLLKSGVARLEDVDLLVLDECHHALRSHAFNMVMSKYRPEAGKPQVGCTLRLCSKQAARRSPTGHRHGKTSTIGLRFVACERYVT